MIKRKAHLEMMEVPEYFLEDLPISTIREKIGKERVAKLSYNESPYGPSPLVGEAIQKVSQEIARYGDPYQKKLVEELSIYTGYPENQIVFGNGADELIDLVCRAFLNPGDEVLIPLPIFGTYLMDPQLADARIQTIPPTKNLEVDLEELLKNITSHTKMIVLCNPNNPTGRLISSKEISEWMRKVPTDVLVVLDEAYAEYVDDTEYYPAWDDLREFSNLMVIRTFSKIFGLAGARLGYAVASRQIVEPIEICRKVANVNSFAAVAGITALKDKKHIEFVKRKNNEERARLSEVLTLLGYTVIPSQTNFLMVRFGPDAKKIWKYLKEKGIFTRFGWNLAEYIRISLGTPEENDWLVEEIRNWQNGK